MVFVAPLLKLKKKKKSERNYASHHNSLQHKSNFAQNNTDQGLKIMHVHMKEHKLFLKYHTPAEKEFLLYNLRRISWQTYKA